MLTIRQAQLDALQRESDRSFGRAVADDLRDRNAGGAATIADERRLELVAAAIARARSYGIADRYSLAMFANLVFLVGIDFDDVPSIGFILRDRTIPPARRLDRVIDSLLPWQWDTVKRRSTPAVPG
jgi:hypothetical protein